MGCFFQVLCSLSIASFTNFGGRKKSLVVVQHLIRAADGHGRSAENYEQIVSVSMDFLAAAGHILHVSFCFDRMSAQDVFVWSKSGLIA